MDLSHVSGVLADMEGRRGNALKARCALAAKRAITGDHTSAQAAVASDVVSSHVASPLQAKERTQQHWRWQSSCGVAGCHRVVASALAVPREGTSS